MWGKKNPNNVHKMLQEDHKATLEILKEEPYHFFTWVITVNGICTAKWRGIDFCRLATALNRSQVGLWCCLKSFDNWKSLPQKVYRSTQVRLKVKGICILLWGAFETIPIGINLEFEVSLKRKDGSIFYIKLDKFINREDFLLNFKELRRLLLFELHKQTQGYGTSLWRWKSYEQKQNGLLKASSPWQLRESNNSGNVLGKISSNDLTLCFIIMSIKEFLLVISCKSQGAPREIW